MKPWLLLPAKLAHDLSPLGLQVLAAFRGTRIPTWRPYNWRGLYFANRLGLAGGVDKDGSLIEEWWKFGAGFIEVGTVTPLAQGPNPGRIIDRDTSSGALWNKMGFPGEGAQAVRQNLMELPNARPTPLFINIGKNRTTSNEHAADDYVECIRMLGDLADALVINISSPNTTGLRDLFEEKNFKPFLTRLLKARDEVVSRRADQAPPLLLKLSPDLTAEDLQTVVRTSADLGVDGFIATNTTLERPNGKRFPSEGGLSGRPLADISIRTLKTVIDLLSPSERQRMLVVSAGGVMTPEDVHLRLELGADLVQTYTALVYEGPGFFGKVARSFEPALN